MDRIEVSISYMRVLRSHDTPVNTAAQQIAPLPHLLVLLAFAIPKEAIKGNTLLHYKLDFASV
jgi:hypothetical protein